VNWAELDALLAGISASAKGEPGWPPPALFRALLLATWHDLSDVRMADALDRSGQLPPVLWACGR
jgi:transposase, IS5 family